MVGTVGCGNKESRFCNNLAYMIFLIIIKIEESRWRSFGKYQRFPTMDTRPDKQSINKEIKEFLSTNGEIIHDSVVEIKKKSKSHCTCTHHNRSTIQSFKPVYITVKKVLRVTTEKKNQNF